jgi:hypothetical protein
VPSLLFSEDFLVPALCSLLGAHEAQGKPVSHLLTPVPRPPPHFLRALCHCAHHGESVACSCSKPAAQSLRLHFPRVSAAPVYPSGETFANSYQQKLFLESLIKL